MNRTDTLDGIEALRDLLEKSTLPGQREAIMADDPLVVVSAGAGTGKTWTLAWRFVWIIATGRAAIPEILTLTFTEKAALEMKDRIRSLLGDVAAKIPALSKTLEQARERMDESFVSTLHSFSMRVIREGGLSIDLDPESRPAGTPEEEEFWWEVESRLDRLDSYWFERRTKGKWLSRQQELSSGTTLMNLVNSYSTRSITALSRGIMALWSSRGETPDELWIFSQNLKEADNAALDRIRSIYNPLFEEEWQRWSSPEGIISGLSGLGESSTKLAERLLVLQREWGDHTPSRQELPQFFIHLMEALKGASGKIAAEIACEIGCSVSEYRNRNMEQMQLCVILSDGLEERDRNTRCELLKISALLWQIWEEQKKRKGLLSFDDMISKAMEAIRSGSMNDRFREVLVDEFQDTNRLQDQLLRAVIEGSSPSMFLVGDLKQSIYRFRHAEPSLFLEYINRTVKGKGRYINLDVSFRSSGKVLEAINSMFEEIWKKGLGRELKHPYEALKSPLTMDWHDQRQKIQTPALEVLVEHFPAGEEKLSAPERRLYMARRLGMKLLEMREKGELVWDRKEERLRPLLWRDMAVLVPTRNQYGALEKVFIEELSIPCYFESNLGYYSRSEVQDLVSLIDYLANPYDQTALASFLSSPFSGLSLNEVSEMLEKAQREGTNTDISAILAEKYPYISSEIDRWRRVASLEGVSKVFSCILKKGETLLAFPVWKIKKAAANLRKAIDIAREYENILGHDMRGCSSYLRDSMGRGIAMEDADSSAERDDVVRIMTVHASKGLEFPVLAITGMEHLPKNRTPGTSISPSRLLGVNISRYPEDLTSDTNDRPSSPFLSRMLEKQELLEEWQRLFYVAATRARDSLLLCGIVEGRKDKAPEPDNGSWLSMIWNNKTLDIPLLEDHVKNHRQTGSGRPSEPAGISVDPPSDNGEYLARLSATSYGLFRFCPLAWRMRHRQGRDLKWELPGDDGPGGSDLGNLAHWLLSKWDFREETIDDLLPDVGKNKAEKDWIPSHILPEWNKSDSRSTLRKWLGTLASSQIGRDLRDLLEEGLLKREIPFMVRMDNGPVLTGTMDVMWEKGNTIHIRDYKITAQEGAPEEIYRRQLQFYGWAGQRALGHDDMEIDMKLILLREGIETEGIGPLREGMGKIGSDIRKVALQAAKGPFEPEKGKCSACPFRKDCCLHYSETE